MPTQLTIGTRCMVRHADEHTAAEYRLVKETDKGYTFARWFNQTKGAIRFVEVPKQPSDILQITEGHEGFNVVYVLSTGGGMLERTPFESMPLPANIKENLKKRHLSQFREFEAVLDY